MTTMANTFGALEIGSAITLFLFGIVTLQAHLYFQTFTEDRRSFKALVAVVWLLEFGHTITVNYEVYRTTILLYGVKRADMRHPAIGAVVIIGTYIATIIQMFFCFRLYSIIPKPFNIIGPATGFLAFARAIVVTYAGVKEITAESYAIFMMDMQHWIMALLAMGAVIDIIIAAAMMHFLFNKRERGMIKNTRLIDKLIAFTVRTGLITSIVAIIVIILYRTLPTGNLVFFAVYTSLSKLYTNSLLAGFNGRVALRDTSNSVSIDVIRATEGTPRHGVPENVTLPYNSNQLISIEMKTTTEFRSDNHSFGHDIALGSDSEPPFKR